MPWPPVTHADVTARIDSMASPEAARDAIGAALVAGPNVTIAVNDAIDTITIAAATGSASADWPSLALTPNARIFNGSMSGTTLTGSGFVAGDVGKKAVVPGAGAAGAALVVTVTAFVSSTSLTVSPSTATPVAGKDITYGTDNSPALQSFFDSVPSLTAGRVGHTAILPRGHYLLATKVSGKQGTRIIGTGTVTGTEGVYDANGSVFMCGVPNGVTMEYVEPTAISQIGADLENVVFWDVTNGGTVRGSTTLLSIKNMNRFNLDRCSFNSASVGVKIDYFKADNVTVGDASWWYIFRSRFSNCGIGIDAKPGGSGQIEGGDWTGCQIGIDLAPEAVPTRIHALKMDVGAGAIGIRGRSFLTTINQVAFEIVSTAGVPAVALDLDGDAAQFYYGTGVKVTNCTFFERGPGPQNCIVLGSLLKRPQFLGNHMGYVTIANSSVNLVRNDTGDTGTGSIQSFYSQPV